LVSGTGRGARDTGLQPERTRLAWRRTALALTVVTLLTVRLALPGDAAGALIGAGAVLLWGGVLALCWPRATGTGAAPSGGPTLSLVALGVVGLAALGVLLVLRGLW
jgi:uncharacterized membrane protein YidH (DUF202 family)